MFYKEKAQHCPGEVCEIKSRHDIQKTSRVQLLVVFGFIACIVLTAALFNDNFRKQPYDLFGIAGSTESK
jgi:hypothetical protein